MVKKVQNSSKLEIREKCDPTCFPAAGTGHYGEIDMDTRLNILTKQTTIPVVT